jgi:hypothetical protein
LSSGFLCFFGARGRSIQDQSIDTVGLLFDHASVGLVDQNRIEFESYRFDTLDYLYGMAERTRLWRVARTHSKKPVRCG